MKKLYPIDVVLIETRKVILPWAVHVLDTIRENMNCNSFSLLTNPENNLKSMYTKEISNKISTLDEYSEFCLDNLHYFVEADFCMVVQPDGFPLNYKSWSDDFLNYDYIGAPWLCKGIPIIGNGGFSIRSKKLLQITPGLQKKKPKYRNPIIDHLPLYLPYNEDVSICISHKIELQKIGIKFADYVTAKRFSVECEPWKDSFGFHGVSNMRYLLHIGKIKNDKIQI